MSVINYMLDFLYPPRCALCNEILKINTTESDEGLCAKCSARLVFISSQTCPRCGIPLSGKDDLCINCSKNLHIFEKNISAYIYKDVAKAMVCGFKYRGDIAKGHVLAKKMLEFVFASEPCFFDNADILIPVPLHNTRQKKRGFNQAEVIAKTISKKVKIPVVSNVLIRHKNTVPQMKLTKNQRHDNMKDAISIINASKIKGKVVVLIDDILTTGSTLDVCAEVLILAGAKKVLCLTISVAMHPMKFKKCIKLFN